MIYKHLYLKIFLIYFFLFSVQLFGQSSYFETKLPIVIIDTKGLTILDEPKRPATMGIIYHSSGSINKSTDPFNHYSGNISIEIRGSTSQEYFPKKSYAFETKDSNFEDKDESLLGLPGEADWILYGPYSDKTFMRNVITYKISRELGNYSSRTKFCELILNNKYNGIYVLMEKLKRGDNRINIAKLKPTDTSGDDLTGGYVIKIDKDTGEYTQSWKSTFPPFNGAWQRIWYQYHSPKSDKLVSEQKQYIRDWIYSFENTMYGEKGHNISDGYDWLDIDSAVDYFLINELVKNKDAYYASIFMYKDKDSNDPKLHMGPVWDMNLSTGNNYSDNLRSPQGWRFEIPISQWELDHSDIRGPFWFEMLWNDSKFKQKFSDRWNSKRKDVLSNQNIYTLIDSYYDDLKDATDRNFNVWNILGIAVWPMIYYNHDNYILDTYEEEVLYLKEWFNERLEWIDNELANNSDITAPATPSNFTCTVIEGGLSLNWDANLEDDLYQYKIYRGSVLDTWKNLLTTIEKNLNYYIDYDISINTSYSYQISAVDYANNESVLSQNSDGTSLDILNSNNSLVSSLEQNSPNPFNPITKISYNLSRSSYVNLTIYDLVGNKIITLLNDFMYSGVHSVYWNSRDDIGNKVGAGVYFYQLSTGDFVKTKKMILLN